MHSASAISTPWRELNAKEQRLCGTCRRITIADLKADQECAHLGNVWDIPLSAETCGMCRLILFALLKKHPPRFGHHADLASALAVKSLGTLKSDKAYRVILGLSAGTYTLAVKVTNKSPQKKSFMALLKLYADPGSSAVGAGLRAGKQLSSHIDSEETYILLRRWLNDCTFTHPDCEGIISPGDPCLPTRVLEVDHSGTSISVRLLVSRCRCGRYMTLSHCWGSSRPLITTTASFQSRCQGIPFDALPKTFHDAVAVTCKLGISYIWIDSLCIIQDDLSDWAQESAVMGDIYARAYCTIAAASARNSTEGFFLPRHFPDTIQLCDSSGDTDMHFYATVASDFHDDVSHSVLNGRAWVLQERILSPRTIHFTNGHIYWECMQGGLAENEIMVYSDINMNMKWQCLSDPQRNEDTPTATPRSWYVLVEDYTERNMTFQKDKFVAISGLANRLQRRTGIRYHCGLWADSVHKGLLWLGREDDLVPPAKYRSPSYSWAAYDGPIQYPAEVYDDDIDSDISIITMVEEYSVPRGSGLLTAASLTIEALVKKAADLGDFLPRDDLVPFTISHFARCRSILAPNGRPIGWVSLDQDSTQHSLHSQLHYVKVSSGQVSNGPTRGMFNWEWSGLPEADEEMNRDVYEGDENDEMDDPVCTADVYDEVEDRLQGDEDVHWLEEAGQDRDSSIIHYLIVLEKTSDKRAEYRRVGMGMITAGGDWFNDASRSVITIV